MRAITETELRGQYKKAEFTLFSLPEGSRLTPAAAQFLSERRIPATGPGSAAANSGAAALPKPSTHNNNHVWRKDRAEDIFSG